MLAGEPSEALSQGHIAVAARAVAQGARAHAHQPQCLTFAQAQSLQLPHDLASCRHGHYFPFSTSRIASTSSIELARPNPRLQHRRPHLHGGA